MNVNAFENTIKVLRVNTNDGRDVGNKFIILCCIVGLLFIHLISNLKAFFAKRVPTCFDI